MLIFSEIVTFIISNNSFAMNISTQSSNNSLTVLTETPGPNDVKIYGSQLLCYKQVLFCFLSNLEKLKAEDSTNNQKLYRPCAKLVVEEIVIHYNKAWIPTIHEKKMTGKVLNLNDEYRNLFKIIPANRLESPKIKEFCAKLEHTMPFWPNHHHVLSQSSHWYTQLKTVFFQSSQSIANLLSLTPPAPLQSFKFPIQFLLRLSSFICSLHISFHYCFCCSTSTYTMPKVFELPFLNHLNNSWCVPTNFSNSVLNKQVSLLFLP